MVKVIVDGKEYYMDGIAKDNFDLVKKKIKDDWDMCFVYSGPEGAGKSTLCFQHAYYCAGKRFTMNHICFTPEDFQEKITKDGFLQPGDALVLDEGFFVNARSSMTELNRRFLGILAECRQKNLFLFIVCPNFFDLDKNLALWRSRGLIYIYHDRMNRGFFKFYSYEKKKKLYIEGKKYYNYNTVKPDFSGRFTKYMPVNVNEYKKKKLDAFQVRQRDGKKDKYYDQRNILMKAMKEKGMYLRDIARYLSENGHPITPQGIHEAISMVKDSNYM